MVLIRFQAPFVHGSGSFDIKNPYNGTLDLYVSADDNGNGLKTKFSLKDSTQYFEIGSGTNTMTVTLSVEGEPSPTKLQLLKNNEVSSDGKPVVGTFKIKVPESSTAQTYKVEITNANGTIKTNGIRTEFVLPMYYGLLETVPTDEEGVLTTLDKLIQPKGSINFEHVNSNYQFFCFAFPAEYGEIKTCIGMDEEQLEGDKTRWNYITAFNKEDITINGIEYYIYYIDVDALYELYNFVIGF